MAPRCAPGRCSTPTPPVRVVDPYLVLPRVTAGRARLGLGRQALGRQPGLRVRDVPGRADLDVQLVDRPARPVTGRVQHQLERRGIYGEVRVTGAQLGRRAEQPGVERDSSAEVADVDRQLDTGHPVTSEDRDRVSLPGSYQAGRDQRGCAAHQPGAGRPARSGSGGLLRSRSPGRTRASRSDDWTGSRQIVQVADRVVTRGGRRCLVLYAWEVPDRLGDEHVAHLVFVFETGGRIEPHEYQITFRPFSISELRARLDLAGLREVATDFDASRDRYAVVTVAT